MIDIKPINHGFGADIGGIDLATITDADFEIIYQAWLDYGVLRFHDQKLTKDSLQAFSQRFGPLEKIPFGKLSKEQQAKIDNLYVTAISNIVIDGKPLGGLGDGELVWHSDMTYVETPPPASVLLGVEIPAQGGDTYFCDQKAAYEKLSDDMKARIANLTIKHDAAHSSDGKLRPGYEDLTDPRKAPGAVHPIVRPHDETGDACLYLGRREWAYIPELSLAESETLLDELWAQATPEDSIIVQKWTPGDVIIWDNRRCLHKRTPIDPTSRRLLLRCQALAREAHVN